MFGIGKTKLTIESFCNDQWIKMTALETQSIWRAFIEQSGDKELCKVDLETFSNCMIGAYSQLLRIAVMNTQKNDVALFFGMHLSTKLKTVPQAEQFFEEFNKAYGSDYHDGIKGMANAFKDMMKPLDISTETIDKIYHEFVTLIKHRCLHKYFMV